ncbi:MAG: hypothetical protein ED859_06285 [Desulfuromonadales bacterium]|nr:MAG: hypothetical protein ED859_06285 [Desulfuromonadales bacterium]
MKLLIACVTVILLAAGQASASLWGTDDGIALTGSRSSSFGIYATDGWANGNFKLSWNVSSVGGGRWEYVYTFDVVPTSGKIKELSHFIVEVTQDGAPFNILAGTSAPKEGPATYRLSGSNPLMPNPLYGVKFDFGSTGGNAVYTMVTDRAPVWGNFYVKDGKDGGTSVVAWNNGLSHADYRTNLNLSSADFIVRPDGSATPAPVPAALWLFGSGLVGMIGVRRRVKE